MKSSCVHRSRVVAAMLGLPALLPLGGCGEGPAAAAFGGGSGGEGLVWAVAHSASLFGADTLVALDPGSGSIDRTLEMESLGGGLAVHQGKVWATDPSNGAVLRIDLRSGEADTVPLGEDVRPESIVIAEGSVWVGSGSDVKVRRVDPEQAEVVAEIVLGEDEQLDHNVRLAAGAGSIWAVEFFGDNDLHRIDPATNAVIGRIRDIGDGAVGIAFGEGAVWVTSVHDGRVHRVDPATLEVVASPQVGRWPLGVAAGHGAIWVANREDESVSRVDPATNGLAATIPVGGEANWVLATADAVWAAAGSSFVRIDPATNQVTATTELSGKAGDLAVEQ